MPLSGSKRYVARVPEALTQGGVGFGDLLPLAFDMKESASGVEHCAARHAHGAAGPAGNMCMREGCAARDQLIQVRGLDLPVPQRTDGVETLIVREKKENIRFSVHIRCSQHYGSGALLSVA